jgi:hypothetical protein
MSQVQRWLGHTLPAISRDRALPSDQIAQIDSMAEFCNLLRQEWSGTRIPSPLGMTAEQIGGEMEAFPHGIAQLLALAAQFE